jgi:hypothetical protein
MKLLSAVAALFTAAPLSSAGDAPRTHALPGATAFLNSQLDAGSSPTLPFTVLDLPLRGR